MSKQEIYGLPEIDTKESTFKLDELIRKLSVATEINNEGDIINALLCLANEIKEIKRKISKGHISTATGPL